MVPPDFGRLVHLTNILAFTQGWLTVGLLAILLSMFGRTITSGYVLLVAILFFTIPLINRYVSFHFGRIFFCLIPIWLTMFITVYSKLVESTFTYIVYFDSRFIILATAVLPAIVFKLSERKQFLFCLLSIFICLVLFDPIHELLGIGFFQKGFTAASYYYINYIVIISFLVLLFGIFFLRSVMERAQNEVEQRNEVLQRQQYEIEAQHEELIQQQEEVIASREMLESANAVITTQQADLEKYNASLEAQVTSKSKELQNTNEELVKHNNELVQFSYTVSHNLRGPVARMLGLSQLLKNSQDADEQQQMRDLVLQSSEELDVILKDLSMIIDIRNELYRVREKVIFDEEWKKAYSLLHDNIKSEYAIHVDFSQAPFMYGVRPMIQSIFYNLLSNAIKYQSTHRDLRVTVRTFAMSASKTILEVTDNGLGLDLERHGHNLFKLYKRLHTHVSGKGLGLYLVKTQAEAMGGNVEVESTLGAGSTFRIVFTQPEGVGKQIFYDSDASQLYFDATIHITVIVWKKNITSQEYRKTWETVLSSLKVYKTQGWVSDVRNQGQVSDEDQMWFAQTIIPEAVKAGLRRAAGVGLAPAGNVYFNRMKTLADSLNVNLQVFQTKEEAFQWMLAEKSAQ